MRATPTALSTVGRAGWTGTRWLLGPLLTILIASFVVFVGLSLAPGDPVTRLLGTHATPAQYALARHRLGLDQPLISQYWHWLTGVLHGDLGTSIVYRTDVTTLLAGRIGTTSSSSRSRRSWSWYAGSASASSGAECGS